MGWILAFALTAGMTVVDTFIPKSGGSALHGYLSSQTEGPKTIVVTQEQGRLTVNLSDYKIQPDSQGRQPHVALISLPGQIELEMETAAFEKAVVDKEIAVVEILLNGKRQFVEPFNQQAGDKIVKTYQGVVQEIRALIRMVQTCPDLPYSQDDLQAALNAVQAQYDAIRMAR